MLGKALKVATFGLCAVLPLAAHANNFNYNMMEFRMGTSPGTFGGEVTTYFTENTHFIGRADSEFSGDWDIAGGIGFNGPAGQFADIYGQMLVHNIKKTVVILSVTNGRPKLTSVLAFGLCRTSNCTVELIN